MREKRLIRSWNSLVVMFLALVMTLGYAIPTGGVLVANAEGVRVGYQLGDVASGLEHWKYVSYNDTKSPAYCLNQNLKILN